MPTFFTHLHTRIHNMHGHTHTCTCLNTRAHKQLLESLQARFSALVLSQDFRSVCHKSEVKSVLLSILESMCGLASSTRIAFVQEFFTYLLPILQTCIKLLPLYEEIDDVITVVLELFTLVAENYIVFLNKVRCLLVGRFILIICNH